jgi:glycine/D-amino acid oxidase-like deaminating enzyme
MNVSSEKSISVWGKTAEFKDAPSLENDTTADVAVVGAGIAGLSIAYELIRAGKRVIVLDRGPLGGGMTARTTGHLASELDDYYHKLIDVRGLEEAIQVRNAQTAAIDRIESIIREERIDCDFRRLDDFLFLAPESDASILEKEFEAARRVGLDVEWAGRAPIPGRNTGRCLCFPNQACFHPLKYLSGLIGAIQARGGRLHAETVVNQVASQKDENVLLPNDTITSHLTFLS